MLTETKHGAELCALNWFFTNGLVCNNDDKKNYHLISNLNTYINTDYSCRIDNARNSNSTTPAKPKSTIYLLIWEKGKK